MLGEPCATSSTVVVQSQPGRCEGPRVLVWVGVHGQGVGQGTVLARAGGRVAQGTAALRKLWLSSCKLMFFSQTVSRR